MPLIKCPDCSKEMSDIAPACPQCGRPMEKQEISQQPVSETKKVSVLLGVGILLFPLLFAWFTLRQGHSVLSRAVAFSWLAVTLMIGFAGEGAPTPRSGESRLHAIARGNQAPSEQEIYDVSIRTLLSDYEGNEVGADNKYKGNWVRVTGVVGDIKKDILDNLYVTIGTGKSFEIPAVQAFFDDSMSEQLGSLRQGQRLTVVCRIDGLMMNVLAKDCFIK